MYTRVNINVLFLFIVILGVSSVYAAHQDRGVLNHDQDVVLPADVVARTSLSPDVDLTEHVILTHHQSVAPDEIVNAVVVRVNHTNDRHAVVSESAVNSIVDQQNGGEVVQQTVAGVHSIDTEVLSRMHFQTVHVYFDPENAVDGTS